MQQILLLAFNSILNSLAMSLNFCSLCHEIELILSWVILSVQSTFWSYISLDGQLVQKQTKLCLNLPWVSNSFLLWMGVIEKGRCSIFFLGAYSFFVLELKVNHALQITSTWPQSPKFGRKPSPSTVQDANSRPPRRPSINTESSKHVLRKNNRITCSVTSLPKNRHENASPNIQLSVAKESISYRHEHGGSVAGGCSRWLF